MKRIVGVGLAIAWLLAVAAPAVALDPAPPEDFAPGISAEEAEPPPEADPPAAPVEGEFRLPAPGDFVTETTSGPVDTTPPKIDSAQFGVGWPAALAVGVALLAVLAMALMWRRHETV